MTEDQVQLVVSALNSDYAAWACKRAKTQATLDKMAAIKDAKAAFLALVARESGDTE